MIDGITDKGRKDMSEITFLASSKPFIIMRDTLESESPLHQTNEEINEFWVSEVTFPEWRNSLKKVFSLPYIYEISTIQHNQFIHYIKTYLEDGDSVELAYFSNQHDLSHGVTRIIETSDPIIINLKSLVYQDRSGTYQMSTHNWIEELSHKLYVNEYSVTTIMKPFNG